MGRRPKQITDYELVRGDDLDPGDQVKPFYDLLERWEEVTFVDAEQVIAKYPPGGNNKYGGLKDRVFVRKKDNQ